MFCGTMSREQTEGKIMTTPVFFILPLCLSLCKLDLKAFEQRLIECVDHMRYKALKWRSEFGHY